MLEPVMTAAAGSALDAGSAVCPSEGLEMSEAAFRALYTATSRGLKSYLARLTSNPTLAEDLLQEAFYRLLRAKLPPMDDAQLKSYLYRTATNLARDHFRASKFQPLPLEERTAGSMRDAGTELSADIQRVLNEIKPNERELLWLAYVEGASHREIAAVTGLKEVSIRPLLFRVRQKMAALLRARGFHGETGR